MSNAHFKSTAHTLAGYLDSAGISYDVYALLNLTDSLIGLSFIDPSIPTPESMHDARVLRAVQSPDVMGHLWDNKKISAIKELRLLANCGLKEAKDAVEDIRVTRMAHRMDYRDDHEWVSDLTDERLR